MVFSMSLDAIKRRVRGWINENSRRNANEVYEVFVEFIKAVAPIIDSRFKRINKWNIEMFDEAIDSLCNYLNGSSAVIALWDEIWDAKIEKRDVGIEEIVVLSKLIDEVERKTVDKRNND